MISETDERWMMRAVELLEAAAEALRDEGYEDLAQRIEQHISGEDDG